MKCPKCQYISFDTPARCRNCGYDFALLETPADPVDGPLRDDGARDGPLPELSLHDERDARVADRPRGGGIDLPLFNEPVPGLDDTPLISSPSAPRAPLAVRRTTPDPSRLPKPGRARGRGGPPAISAPTPSRPTPAEPSRVAAPAPASQRHPHDVPATAAADLLDVAGGVAASDEDRGPRQDAAPAPTAGAHAAGDAGDAASAMARLTALAADVSLLALINVAVVHFTLAVVRYPWSRLGELPLLPLVAFCAMLDAGYFVLLTAASGQTLGKMFTGVRVVAADAGRVPVTQAALRTALAPLSIVTLGLGYLPGLVGRDRRTLHDRLSHTRVIRA